MNMNTHEFFKSINMINVNLDTLPKLRFCVYEWMNEWIQKFVGE